MDQNHRLVDVALRIADGAPIDWAAVEASATPGETKVLEYLRAVERLARVHASTGTASHESVPGTPPSAQAHTPATWGPLSIIEKIGRGTYGDVYRALDPKLDRPVALKLLRRREKDASALESAVIEEGRLLARVRHPNVVTVYGAERIDGRVGLWMEFVGTGHTLEDELRTRGPLPVADVAAIGRDLAAALGAVHRAGLLHRDVKAQNVMRDADNRIVLTDFGAGHPIDDADKCADGQGLAGTPLYLAPEVLDGAPASVASDLYSLGRRALSRRDWLVPNPRQHVDRDPPRASQRSAATCGHRAARSPVVAGRHDRHVDRPRSGGAIRERQGGRSRVCWAWNRCSRPADVRAPRASSVAPRCRGHLRQRPRRGYRRWRMARAVGGRQRAGSSTMGPAQRRRLDLGRRLRQPHRRGDLRRHD